MLLHALQQHAHFVEDSSRNQTGLYARTELEVVSFSTTVIQCPINAPCGWDLKEVYIVLYTLRGLELQNFACVFVLLTQITE